MTWRTYDSKWQHIFPFNRKLLDRSDEAWDVATKTAPTRVD